jgi:hypothetical protein
MLQISSDDEKAFLQEVFISSLTELNGEFNWYPILDKIIFSKEKLAPKNAKIDS